MIEKNTQPLNKNNRKHVFTVLKKYLAPQKHLVIILFCLSLVTAGLNIYLPSLIASFIDKVSGHKVFELNQLITISVSFIGIALVMQVTLSVSTYLAALVGWQATNKLRADLMKHMLLLDMDEHKNRTPGEMIERIDGDVTSLSDFFSKFLVLVLIATMTIAGVIFMYFNIALWIGTLVTTFVYFTSVSMIKKAKKGEEPSRLERESSAKMYGYIEERLTGLEDIRALGAGRHHQTRFISVLKVYFNRVMIAWRARAEIWRVSMLFFAIGYTGILGLGLWLYSSKSITVGVLFLMFQYMRMIEFPLDQIAGQLQEFQKAVAGVVRINELLQLKSNLSNGKKELTTSPVSVKFKNVSFCYDNSQLHDNKAHILKNINFTLHAGETMGLLGRTGSGKSTLTRLVAKLYEPTNGEVKLDDIKTNELSTESLRRKIAVVTQEVQLFNASIKDNLTFFDNNFSNQSVEDAINMVGMEDWLKKQPNGIHTSLPVNSLSAGQAQLIAFSRVLLRDPAIVILDEPSSRLDPSSEATLTKAIQKLLQGRTAIIIAHRLKTVEQADRIMVIGEGEVLEYDSREALLKNKNSHYNKLLLSGKKTIED